jgi:hypothetical protein
MAWSRKTSAALAVAVAAIATGGRARAQAPEAPPVIPVEIGAGEGASLIELQGPGGSFQCGTHCSLGLTQGRYRVLVMDAHGNVSTQWLPVEQPSRLTVTPASRGARVGGIVVMVAGIGVAAVGAFVLWATFLGHYLADCFDNCRNDWPKGQLYGGAITLAAGAALGVTGLVVWRRNVHAVVNEASPAPPAGAAARLRLAPVAGLRWAGVGLTGSF